MSTQSTRGLINPARPTRRARPERPARKRSPLDDTTTRTLVSGATLKRRRGRVLYWIVATLVIVGFTLIFLGPLYFLFTDGLKSTKESVQSPPTLYPHSIHPGSYAAAWNKTGIARLLANTLYYAFGALAFQLVFDVACAYAISKLRPRFGNVIFGMMLATLMIPALVLVVPQYLTVADVPFVHLNLIGSPAAIWLPSVANGFSIFLLKRFFDSIPDELLQAAAIDGAGRIKTLWSIVLPMSRPILAVVSIFAVTSVWKDFLWPKLVEGGYSPTRETLNVGLTQAANTLPQNMVIAASAIAAVPAIIFFLIFQRNIMAGLTAGSLKG